MFRWHWDDDGTLGVRVSWITRQKIRWSFRQTGLNSSYDYQNVVKPMMDYNPIVYSTSYEANSLLDHRYGLIRNLSYWTWVSYV